MWAYGESPLMGPRERRLAALETGAPSICIELRRRL